MAIIPANQFPGQIAPISDDYPQGSARNISAPGVKDGTPLVEPWVNDIWGFVYKMMRETGKLPSDVVDTTKVSQFFDALTQIAQAGQKRMLLANDLIAPDSKIVVKKGVEWDSTRLIPIALLTDLTKDITLPWVVGNGNGGYASALPLAANTWYNIFVIKSTETEAPGIVDIAIDADINATNALAVSGYTYYERIGSILTDNFSNILPMFMFQIGSQKKIIWKDRVELIIPAPAPGNSVVDQLQIINVPPSRTVNAIIGQNWGYSATPTGVGGLARGHVFSPFIIPLGATAFSDATRTATMMIPNATGSVNVPECPTGCEAGVMTNTSSQVAYALLLGDGLPASGIYFKLAALGWYE